jgi:pyrroloquinoline quinone biosynthesis protein B
VRSGAALHVLGTAQDGGLPHAGCGCPNCEAARVDPWRRRRVACVGVVGVTGKRLLVDATPDLPEQIEALRRAAGAADALPDALLLTHAHVGHYLGLAWFGREALSTRGLPVRATASMAAFLGRHRPWAHLVDRGEIALEPLEPGRPFDFDGVRVEAFPSPHRAEDSDTVGLEVSAGGRRVCYLPDADRLTDDLVRRIGAADVALVDGTFFHAEELPGRDLSTVPHPFVAESVVRLAPARDVRFTHLNHSNALLQPEPGRRPALPPGFSVLEEGAALPLGADA